MSNKSSKQDLLKWIRELEKINKNQQQKIKDLEGVNEAQREIMRIYIPKIKKDKVKEYYKWFNNERIYKNSNNKLVANDLFIMLKKVV